MTAQKEVQFMDAERFTHKSVDNLDQRWLMKPLSLRQEYPVVLQHPCAAPDEHYTARRTRVWWAVNFAVAKI